MQPVQIPTRWASLVRPTNVLPEYPRPQLVRRHWQNLNGLWHYSITAKNSKIPAQFDGSILVPYPLESALAGVQRPLQPDQLLWYRRTITLTPQSGRRTLIHFGAVNYQATVYVNGQEVGVALGAQNLLDNYPKRIKAANDLPGGVLRYPYLQGTPHGMSGILLRPHVIQVLKTQVGAPKIVSAAAWVLVT